MSTKKKLMNLSAKPAPSIEEFIAGTTPSLPSKPEPVLAPEPPAPIPSTPQVAEKQEGPKRGRPPGEAKNPRNITITDKLYKEAKYLAVDRGISFSDLIAFALEDYLEKHKG